MPFTTRPMPRKSGRPMCFIVSSRRSKTALPSSSDAPWAAIINSALIPAATGRTRPRLRMSAHSKWCREQTSDSDTLFRAVSGWNKSGASPVCSASHTTPIRRDRWPIVTTKTYRARRR